jgi:hypothetical protein
MDIKGLGQWRIDPELAVTGLMPQQYRGGKWHELRAVGFVEFYERHTFGAFLMTPLMVASPSSPREFLS